jgi:hypothetical protein
MAIPIGVWISGLVATNSILRFGSEILIEEGGVSFWPLQLTPIEIIQIEDARDFIIFLKVTCIGKLLMGLKLSAQKTALTGPN